MGAIAIIAEILKKNARKCACVFWATCCTLSRRNLRGNLEELNDFNELFASPPKDALGEWEKIIDEVKPCWGSVQPRAFSSTFSWPHSLAQSQHQLGSVESRVL